MSRSDQSQRELNRGGVDPLCVRAKASVLGIEIVDQMLLERGYEIQIPLVRIDSDGARGR